MSQFYTFTNSVIDIMVRNFICDSLFNKTDAKAGETIRATFNNNIMVHITSEL